MTFGRGGGLMVSVLAFYSHDPSSNPSGYLNFLYEKTKKSQGLAHLKKKLFKAIFVTCVRARRLF